MWKSSLTTCLFFQLSTSLQLSPVAAAGIPNRRREHALVMAKFARDCMYQMWKLSKEFKVTLGPETGKSCFIIKTKCRSKFRSAHMFSPPLHPIRSIFGHWFQTGDLDMRMGIHSGPVTAGILRGDRARFQLFGDTMVRSGKDILRIVYNWCSPKLNLLPQNVASRIETTGRPNCIHLSSETAELIIAVGKPQWVTPRQDVVRAKGKNHHALVLMKSEGQFLQMLDVFQAKIT